MSPAPLEVFILGILNIPGFASAHTDIIGIGEAITKYLINHGCNVVVVARSREPLEKIKVLAKSQIRVLAGDLRDYPLAQKAVDLALEEFGHLDGVVINHGVMTKASRLLDSSIEEWKYDYDVNVFSAVAFVGRPRLCPAT